MNTFTLKVLVGLGDAIRIMSTLDRTYQLSATADERVAIGEDDVTVIKNTAETVARLQITGETDDGGRAIFRPSRQQSFTIFKGRTRELTLGPGESCVIEHEMANRRRMQASGKFTDA